MNIGLSAGLRALTAARLGIETAGQNVANANTPGYTRQNLVQSAAFPFTFGAGLQIGTGVEVNDIRRIHDAGLERRLREQLASYGSAEIDFYRWSEIESVFNEPTGGLSTHFTDFFGSIGKLQTQPADRALRGGTVQEGVAFADALNQLNRRLTSIEDSSFTEIDGHVKKINELAGSVATLNDQISVMEASGTSANDLRDRRESLIKEIGQLTDVAVIERKTGAVDVLVDGLLLVTGNRANKLEAVRNSGGKTQIFVAGGTTPIEPTSGRIEALMRHEDGEIPRILKKLDGLAKNLALEFNRIHTTGVPLAGHYDELLSANPAKDLNQNGVYGDDILSSSGFPFDITNGEVYVSVTNKTSGELTQTRIPINPASMSLQSVAAALNNVTNLDASVDPSGRLRVKAASGYGFDFSTRLDPNPDDLGTFGGAQPSMGSSKAGPYNLTVPSTLRITIDGTDHDIGFTSTQFGNAAAATVDEVVAAINGTAGFSAAGLAANVGGRLVIRSNSSGTSATLAMTEPGPGTPLSDLSLPSSPNTQSGQASAVKVTVGGTYTGSTNDRFTFVAESSGTIGSTSGLTIGVYDSQGIKVATLDAGPNTQLLDNSPMKVADGITLTLSPGQLHAGQVFSVDALADSDTSDFLVAIGLNSFFHGSSSSDLAVNPELIETPAFLAASTTGEEGDATNLDRLLKLRDLGLTDLETHTLEDFYADVVGAVGFEASGASTILYAEDQLTSAIQAQRDAVSGVNLDEEMIDLVRYQQSFEAATRYINTVNELLDTLIDMVR